MLQSFHRLQGWLSLAARLLLAAIWLFAGWEKATHFETTIDTVRAFQLLPEAVVRPFGYALPMVEVLLGVLLLLGLLTRGAAVVTSGMMVMFLFGISTAWARGLSIQCGCFGGGGQISVDPVPGYIQDLIRDTGFLVAAVFLVRWPWSRLSLDGPLGLTYPPADVAEVPIDDAPAAPPVTGTEPVDQTGPPAASTP